MNARDNTPLRAQIADRLAAGEDTAAGIAKAIGKGDTPSIVVKELNAMRTDGQVECEQRGKKKELVYWLAVPLDVAAGSVEPERAPDLVPATISEVMLPKGVRHGTRAAQIYRVLPLYGAKPLDARAIATATGCAKALIDGALWAMVKAGQCVRHSTSGPYGYTRLPPAGSDSEGGETDVKAQSAEFPPQIQPQITPAQAASDEVERDDAMPPADASLLALANRELSDRLARVADVLRGSGLEALENLDDGADLQVSAAALTGAYQMALAELHACTGKIADLQHKVSMQDAELFKQAGVVVDLRNQLGEERTARQAELDGRSRTVKVLDDLIRTASETLAPCVPGGLDTSDMDLQEIAEAVAIHVADLAVRLGRAITAHEALQEARSPSKSPEGYLVRTPKRPLRAYRNADSAQAAALAAARNGSGRGEVFELVPVGKAVRGAEWRPA